MRRGLRWSAAVAVTCVVLAAMSFGIARGQEAETTGGGDLISYTGHASAPGIEFVYDNSSFPVPAHPVFTGTLPEATADLQAGPSGTAFGSVAWPGPLAGNLGTTIKQLNQLCGPPNLMLPCLPISPEMKDLLGGANYPIRAYASSSGNNDASYGGAGALYMRAHANPTATVATADAGISSLEGNPVLTLGSVTSHAGSTAAGSTITGEATSSITGITVGTNLPVPNLPIPANTSILTIDSITSVARAVSDGVKQVRPTGGITVAGVKVLGQPATITEKGLTVGTSATALDPVLKPLLDAARQALASLKFAVTFAPNPDLRITGTQAVSEIGGVTISFATSDGSSYKITLGKALAMADASPNVEVDVDVPAIAGGDGLAGADPGAGADTGTGAAVTGGESLGDTGSGSAGGDTSANGSGATVTGVLTSGSPPGGANIGTALIVLVLLAAGVLAFGMKRLSDDVLSQKAGVVCPNEGNP